jgi:hypothetical protein
MRLIGRSLLGRLVRSCPTSAAFFRRLNTTIRKRWKSFAAAILAQEKPGKTLQATALVHEAYVPLVDGKAGAVLERSRPLPWSNC